MLEALQPSGLDPIASLWPGLPLPPALANLAMPVAERLSAAIAHPAFQLK